jgi:hypothetical protein
MVWTPNSLLCAYWRLLCTLKVETTGTLETLAINHRTTSVTLAKITV